MTYIVGAWMAQRIEQQKGAPALVRTIENGAQDFVTYLPRNLPASGTGTVTPVIS